MTELPMDIIYDILSRMPLKSLARFRCVSKLWYSYIRDSQLEIMHAKRADPNIIIFHFQKRSGVGNNSALFGNTHHDKVRRVFANEPDSVYTVVEMTKKKPGTLEFLCQGSGSRFWDHERVLGSCKGLVYSSFSTHRKRGHAIMDVINPLKKECHRLPPLKIFSEKGSSYGLGFDDSNSTFKMVCIALRECRPTSESGNVVTTKVLCTMVHVLGSKSWQVKRQVPAYLLCGQGVFAHGFLHWLVSDLDNWRAHYQKRPIILFDVRKDKFGLINVPKQTSSNSDQDHLFDLNGQVGFVYDNIDKFTMEVWVLKHTEWVMQCQFDKAPPLPRDFILVLGVWNKDGDILITYRDREWRFFVYGLKNGFLLDINSEQEKYKGKTDIQMYQSSLFSIHYSIKNQTE